jgi:cytochrome b6-f complex iron-sulfur subunit
MAELDRRSFLKRGASIFAIAAGGLAITTLLRQIFPRSVGQRKRIKVGKSVLYPVDTFTYLTNHKVFIYRDHEGVKAVSAICTHLGCVLEINDEGFICPCHGSCYDKKGEVLSGPAPRGLIWYQVGKAPDGQLMIDLTRKVEPEFKFLTT